MVHRSLDVLARQLIFESSLLLSQMHKVLLQGESVTQMKHAVAPKFFPVSILSNYPCEASTSTFTVEHFADTLTRATTASPPNNRDEFICVVQKVVCVVQKASFALSKRFAE